MTEPKPKAEGIGIALFLVLTVLLTSPWWWAVHENSSSVYVTLMMWSPGLAAVLSQWLTGRPLSALGWQGASLKMVGAATVTTLLWMAASYAPIYGLGLVNFAPADLLTKAATSVHGPEGPRIVALVCFGLFMATAGSVRLAGAALGEELGWRGFLAPALCRRYGFRLGALLSSLLWATWHFPIMIGQTSALHLAAFSISIMGIGVAMAWFRSRSGSVWPSTVMHALHNSLLIGFFEKLTPPGAAADRWLDETGYSMALVGLGLVVLFLFVLPSPNREGRD